MRNHREPRVRTLSDSQLESALVDALADWLTTLGPAGPPPRLTALYDAYSRRLNPHGPRCQCASCFVGYADPPWPYCGDPDAFRDVLELRGDDF